MAKPNTDKQLPKAKPPADTATALVMIRSAAGLDSNVWSDERIEAVRTMCAPTTQNIHELAMFLSTCNRYDLDPLQKEAWLAQMDGKPTVVVGRDGYLKIAGKDPNFLGFQADVVREKDDYQATRNGKDVHINHKRTGFNRGAITGAYAVIRRRGMDDLLFELPWEEVAHMHDKKTYKRHPSQMLLTRALTFALKLAYNLSGVYSEADVALEHHFDETEPAETDMGVMEKTKSRIEELAEKLDMKTEEEEEVIEEAEYVVVDDENVDTATGEVVEDPDEEVIDAIGEELTHAEADAAAAAEEGELPFA